MGGGRRRPLYVDVVVAVVVIALIGVVGVWLNGRSGGSDRSSALVPADGGSSQGGPTEPRTVETVPVVTGSVPRSSSGDDGGQGGATRSTLPREQRAKVSGTAAAVSRLVLRNASGAEATVVIKRGKLEAQAEGATNGAVLGEECDFDEDADAAMPLDITVEAAAPPAAYSLSVEMDFRAPTDFDRSSPSLVVDTEALHSPDTRVCIFRHENRPIFATVRGNGVTSASPRGWVLVAG